MNRLELLRSMPCCNCGADPRSQVAHSNFGEHGKGKSIKADDKYTIPLCHTCHADFDQYRHMTREQSKAWFMEKWEFINGVISEIQAQN